VSSSTYKKQAMVFGVPSRIILRGGCYGFYVEKENSKSLPLRPPVEIFSEKNIWF